MSRRARRPGQHRQTSRRHAGQGSTQPSRPELASQRSGVKACRRHQPPHASEAGTRWGATPSQGSGLKASRQPRARAAASAGGSAPSPPSWRLRQSAARNRRRLGGTWGAGTAGISGACSPVLAATAAAAGTAGAGTAAAAAAAAAAGQEWGEVALGSVQPALLFHVSLHCPSSPKPLQPAYPAYPALGSRTGWFRPSQRNGTGAAPHPSSRTTPSPACCARSPGRPAGSPAACPRPPARWRAGRLG